MNGQYDNTNRGALFKNEDKKSDSHPDYKGNINVGGQEYWLSAWIKTSKAGKKFMNLSVQPKEAGGALQGMPKAAPVQVSGPFEDDIPF